MMMMMMMMLLLLLMMWSHTGSRGDFRGQMLLRAGNRGCPPPRRLRMPSQERAGSGKLPATSRRRACSQGEARLRVQYSPCTSVVSNGRP